MTSFDCPFFVQKCVPCSGRVFILVWYISLPTPFFVETMTEEQVTLFWFGIVFPFLNSQIENILNKECKKFLEDIVRSN